MLVQEPIQAAIWHCLNHYAYLDAVFLAERLLAEVDSEEALVLLATAYYRAGKAGQAYVLLHSHGTRSPQAKYIMARCCCDLGKMDEAETILTGSSVLRPKAIDEIAVEYGSLACFVLQLLGQICVRTERLQRATEAFKKSLKLNPFMWYSYISLCDIGDKTDASKVFKLDGIESFSNCHGSTFYSCLSNSQVTFGNTSSAELTSVTNTSINAPLKNAADNTSIQQLPGNLTNTTMQAHQLSPFTPLPSPNLQHTNTNSSTPISSQQVTNISTPVPVTITPFLDTTSESESVGGMLHAPKKKKYLRIKSVLAGGPASVSPLTPSFGVLPLDATPSEGELMVISNSFAFLTPPLAVSQDVNVGGRIPAPLSKRILCRNMKDTQIINKPTVFAPAGNNSNFQSPPAGQGIVRRSSRLFGNNNSVKENNKNRFTAPKSPAKKTKAKSSKTQPSLSELNEKNKSENQEIISDTEKPVSAGIQNISIRAFSIQRQSADGLMSLLKEMATAYQYISQYNSKQAIDILSSLPLQHYDTGWVLSHIGKAYFELNDYQQAVRFFVQVREKDPHRLEFMEYYSTALWHLQKEVQLSALAQDLVEKNRESPQAWCAAGNCFSLQKEHEAAIKFFSRAVQVDPGFVYSYTLLGHEHIATEELDRALGCYRSAVRIDPRHYNAWYGIGLVLYKQEQFAQSESYFKKALSIHPNSPVLMCHVAVVEHSLQKSTAALTTLNKALAVEPKNPICKYHKASILHAIDRNEEALEELLQLKELVPKESGVHFLLSKVYNKLGLSHSALMSMSWAMDIDPKGANTHFKDDVDPAISRFSADNDTTNNNPHENGSESSSLALFESSQESLILEPMADLQHQPTMESLSDESL